MKSRNDIYVEVASGVFKDIRAAYPMYRGVDRDFERLTRLIKDRGQGVYLLDLPLLDDALLAGLEGGVLTLEGIPHSRCVSKKVRVPRFLSGLWLRVFDTHGCLKECPDTTAIFMLRQILCLGKKIEVACAPQRLKESIDEYARTDGELPEPTLKWHLDQLPDPSNMPHVHFRDCVDADIRLRGPEYSGYDDEYVRRAALLEEYQRTADSFVRLLGHYDPFAQSFGSDGIGPIGFKHGPGAVSDGRLSDENFSKFSFPNWPSKLSNVFPRYPFGSIQSDIAREVESDPEPCARLIAVPKTAKGPRLIASEPVAHQWAQQAFRKWLEDRIRVILGDFIDFKNQSLSASLACEGSRARSLATVDLSSASDRLSAWLMERFFRRNYSVLETYHAIRTRQVENRIKGTEPFILTLRKAFSQGTAVTFPTQSMIFAIAAISLAPGYGFKEKIKNCKGKVRVFGDDIIIPNNWYARLVDLLHLLGLKVNVRKSFTKGFFREACGGDYYRGDDVTPVKPRSIDPSKPGGVSALIESSNNFFKKGLWHTSKAIEGLIVRELRSVPIIRNTDRTDALYSFSGTALDHLNTRWNEAYQRHECKIRTLNHKVKNGVHTGHELMREYILTGKKKHQLDFLEPSYSRLGRVRVEYLVPRYSWVPVDTLQPAQE